MLILLSILKIIGLLLIGVSGIIILIYVLALIAIATSSKYIGENGDWIADEDGDENVSISE